ncbi:Thioredoxin-like fold domain-containing protein mrl7l protein [Thalictrum thalictroides]|uniref:Thioredoxin-like fold domain-containing protein mrl7l protein n=1 Tax=Thalictrum thalictroides TaxID=46969 RepID=A0A7J6V4A1_THATH|nr:Thioredoxin-like fold domain-containing protein mrl7l protein [Thalictrum thalictroides]
MAVRATTRPQSFKDKFHNFKSSSSSLELASIVHFQKQKQSNFIFLSSKTNYFCFNQPKYPRASNKFDVEVVSDDGKKKRGDKDEDDFKVMDEEERREWRKKIREVIDKNSDVDEVTDPIERKKKMEHLLSEYPLVVDEEDPDWPEDADGWGFNLGQFFDKISIKNVKKDDDDDENYDSDKEIVWQDDDYIRPIKEISTKEWEEIVFKDISPLVVFVHNRYKRPKENEMVRQELEKVAHIFWNCGLPSPRCVAVDAVVEVDLVSALNVSVFPEVLYTKAGRILYREKVFRSADELSKIMGYFYYGAAKPPCLGEVGHSNEMIPSAPNNTGQ